MFLRKNLFFTFFAIYEISLSINAQEYLKELKPKYFRIISHNELPPVELPRPLLPQSQDTTVKDEPIDVELISSKNRLQKSQKRRLHDVALEASVREGLNAMRRLYSEIEPNMVKNGHLLQDNHPAALLSKFSAPVVETTKREMAAYATLTATKVYRKNYDLNSDLARQAHSQKVSLRRTALESLCPPRDPPSCMPASERYRTHDGTCNNRKRLRWGAAQMPFNRFLPPEYGDGVDTVRLAEDGGPLSSSRFVSLVVHGARDGEAPLTLMLAQWGQLLDHDLTSTAQPRSINGSVPSCCGRKDFHPSCFPIKVPLDDPWLSPLKVRCLEFLRSAPAQRRDCALSWREQTNQATSFIDASPIYSSNVKSSDTARVFRKGLLIYGRGNPADDVCQRGAIATHCIRSGDGRSGEQPGLLALHHVWVNEHNNIAMKLSEINLHWSDEKIYQETRRIIGAMFQHITFREFLPIVLGREVLKLFELELLTNGYYDGYDLSINPTVANAFSAAAFRFGHSLVQNSYMRCDRFHNVINNNVSLHEEFQRGDIGSVGSLHRLLRGMATQRALKRDEFITPELTNHLFQTPGFPFGLDLAAINVQRGRDHGIPPYVRWRVPCGLSSINTWEEFANVVGPESARRISHAYHSVQDIDLFVGGIAERPVVGGLVGPTFACIIAQQFSNSRKGDRFWYENGGFESSFTPAQLHSIRRVSLASVLCRAVGGGTFQPHIFLPPEFPNNERLPCGVASLGDFDIGPWLEQDPFAQTAVQQPLPPTFKPQTIPTTTLQPHFLPDRIFDIMQLEIKSPENSNTSLGGNKVGFSNRITASALIKGQSSHLTKKPHIDIMQMGSNGFLIIRNSSKINDKLDLKKKNSPVHITKQKPKPAVNNKLDRNNHNGNNRHGTIENTTRRTIIVHNIPIELRNAGKDKNKKGPTVTENEPEPRTANTEVISIIEKTKQNSTEVSEAINENEEEQEKVKTNVSDQMESDHQVENNNNEDKNEEKGKETKIYLTDGTEHSCKTKDDSASLENKTIKLNLENTETPLNNKQFLTNDKNTTNVSNDPTNIEFNNENGHKEVKNSTDLETQMTILNKNVKRTESVQESEPKNLTLTLNSNADVYDADIDPLVQATPTEHKRVRRKLIPPGFASQLKDKFKLKTTKNETTSNSTHIPTNNNRSLTTKAPKLKHTTVRTLDLRQYQSRPLFTKTPQKVIVDSVNGDNQYEIEINIRQTNKSPKPVQSIPPYVTDYTSGYKPNQFDRYINSYQTTPTYASYQPAPPQITPLNQNQRTKPPTIIFVNEHDEHTSTKLPGFLQSIAGWNLGTKSPLPPSIGFNERPGHSETIIGSPHSTANVQPVYQKPPTQLALPAGASSFSQAQVAPAGIVQASSSSISNGNFGSIAGFASANGADSIFSFNIRPKPDITQSSRPTASGGSYGLELPSRNPWYETKPITGQHISTYDQPYRENINSPFSTFNIQKQYKATPQRTETLTLTPAHEFVDLDYAERTLLPLSNITLDEEIQDNREDYEYDEDYGTSPLLRNFNQDGYLRPEHMIETILKNLSDKNGNDISITSTSKSNHTLDDNYVLPVLSSTKELRHDLPTDLPKPINSYFSTNFTDALAKHLNNDIFADDNNNVTYTNHTKNNNEKKDVESRSQVQIHVSPDHQRKRNKNRHTNNKRNREKIPFAPLNVLTKPERPDNWVFFETPNQKETLLPELPEITMDPIPSNEFPKPFKENIWPYLSKTNRKVTLKFQGPSGHLQQQQTDNTTELKPDSTARKVGDVNKDTLQDTETTENLPNSQLVGGPVMDLKTNLKIKT